MKSIFCIPKSEENPTSIMSIMNPIDPMSPEKDEMVNSSIVEFKGVHRGHILHIVCEGSLATISVLNGGLVGRQFCGQDYRSLDKFVDRGMDMIEAICRENERKYGKRKGTILQ